MRFIMPCVYGAHNQRAAFAHPTDLRSVNKLAKSTTTYYHTAFNLTESSL